MARRLTVEFLRTESGAGLLLAAAATAAILADNSPWAASYQALIASPIAVRLGGFAETRSLASWVADGLMALFFLVLSMELKFEILRGELASPRRLALPAFAALGGLALPVAIYLGVNLALGGDGKGWGAAGATDIALALAVLAIVAPRMPSALRIFLLTVGLADTLAAAGLTALAGARGVNGPAVAGALLTLVVLVALSRWRRAPFLFYAALFVLAWGFTLRAGVSASMAGIACAMTVPVGARRAGQESTLKYFMDSLHPYVAFGVLPLFVLTAAGFPRAALSALGPPVPLGLILALAIGKPAGVFGASLIACAVRLARRPAGVTWVELFGAALLTGVGFTPSLFIGGLALAGAEASLRPGALAGSLIAALAGAAVLLRAQALRSERAEDAAD